MSRRSSKNSMRALSPYMRAEGDTITVKSESGIKTLPAKIPSLSHAPDASNSLSAYQQRHVMIQQIQTLQHQVKMLEIAVINVTASNIELRNEIRANRVENQKYPQVNTFTPTFTPPYEILQSLASTPTYTNMGICDIICSDADQTWRKWINDENV